MKQTIKRAKAFFAFAIAVSTLSPLTFAQRHHRDNNQSLVTWTEIRGEIMAPGVDNPVGVVTTQQGDQTVIVNPGISAGTTPWTTTSGRAVVDLQTGAAAFQVRGLVLNGGNRTGTPGPVDQVEGTLICSPGALNEAIVTFPPVPLSSTGDAQFSGNIGTVPAPCDNPLFLVRIGPDLPAANERWLATGAVRVFGGQD